MSHDARPPVRIPPYRVQTVLHALAETVDWGLSALNVPAHWTATRGQGVRVAVLDTGIDAAHPDLASAIDDAKDFTSSRSGVADRVGHGTHVAGIIGARRNDRGVVGVAPECRLLIAKVLGDDGSGDSDRVAAGIDWACEQGADILSLSLGSPEASESMRAAVERSVQRERFVICAAGNSGRPKSVDFPARWPDAIAVGAVDRDGRVTSFSSRGDEVDISAPGQDVLSTYPNGQYAKLSGTSMAAPFVSGVAALLMAKHRATGGATPVATHRQLVEHLLRSATDAGPIGKDPNYGYGLIHPDSVLADLTPAPVAAGIWIFVPGGAVRT
jgi:subtilisin family serine protease